MPIASARGSFQILIVPLPLQRFYSTHESPVSFGQLLIRAILPFVGGHHPRSVEDLTFSAAGASGATSPVRASRCFVQLAARRPVCWPEWRRFQPAGTLTPFKFLQSSRASSRTMDLGGKLSTIVSCSSASERRTNKGRSSMTSLMIFATDVLAQSRNH